MEMNIKYRKMLDKCVLCNELLSEFSRNSNNLYNRKIIEEKIEKFLEDNFLILRDYKEYQALFLKYIYIKEGIENRKK